ncbi:cysteine desulfurase family protein [Sphingomicrobium nitratireducens]|uniref:cysteine desulfurase family protein n=1 Tax=Sphingomicrobium nitratireducens TaxID=2964666 RepID=UPI00223EE164|nr:aminotransferase class V-fold PLP-dependent enzyme [Sphingomicrobium nitratireducens]
MTDRLYFDHAAATPIHASTREAMARAMDIWANPNSPYAEARAARAAMEEARRSLKDGLGWRHDVIFTSGASEAVSLCARCARVEGRAHGATEHAIVPASMGADSRIIPVNEKGLVDMDALDAILAEGPALVAIQQVNNETGVLQPLEEIYAKVKAAGSLLLADCAQGGGKLPLPDADFIALSGHKMGGPPGVGALLVKDIGQLEPCGGGQEKGYRRGTQNMPAIVGMAGALDGRGFLDAMERFKFLRERFENAVKAMGGVVIAEGAPRTPAIGAIALPGASSAAMLVQLDLAGIAVSAGSACSSGAMKPSAVLEAMGLPDAVKQSFLRISFGPDTSETDVDRLVEALQGIAIKARATAA